MGDFTKGDWVADGSAIKANGEHIITAWGLGGRISEERELGESWLQMRERTLPAREAAAREGQANARLIAAAPDMFEALEDIGRGKLQGPGDFETYVKAVCEKVLAKARGES